MRASSNSVLMCGILHFMRLPHITYKPHHFESHHLEQTRGQHFRGPDCFVVLGVPRGERKSWVIWEQGKVPDVVIEFLSESTAAHDKGEKKQIHQDLMRVPECFWFDPFAPEDRGAFVWSRASISPSSGMLKVA
jgi:hypothetical protein